jgi:hypothetical protein
LPEGSPITHATVVGDPGLGGNPLDE